MQTTGKDEGRREVTFDPFTVREGDDPGWCTITRTGYGGEPRTLRVELTFQETAGRIRDHVVSGGDLRITQMFADQDADVREFLISGTLPGEWEQMTGGSPE